MKLAVVSSMPQKGWLSQPLVRLSETISTGQARTTKKPYAPNVILRCYRCGENGHKSNVCPKHGLISFAASIKKDIEHEALKNVELEKNFLEFDNRDTLSHSLVLRRLMYTPKKEKDTQHHNISRIRCTMNTKISNIIIDNGNCENIVSYIMVWKLGLRTNPHPHPYRIGYKNGYIN